MAAVLSGWETRPMAQTRSTRDAVAPALGILLAIVFGIPFLLFGWMALSSRFGGTDADPHGYALIVGTVLALVAGLVTALAVPMIFPRTVRASVFLGSMGCYLAVAAGLVIALLTA